MKLRRIACALDLELDGLGLEREHEHKEHPCKKEHDDDIRDHAEHPVDECHLDACVLKGSQGDCVWRSSDRSTHTAEISGDRNRERKTHLTLLVLRESSEYRSKECKHHCSCSRVAHEHREDTDDEEESQKHHLRVLSERLEENLCEGHVKTNLRSRDSEHESTEEEHDHRVGESCHDRLVVNICTCTIIHHEAEALV